MAYLQQAVVMKSLSMAGRKMLRDRVEKPAVTMVLEAWKSFLDDVAAFARGVWAREKAEASPMGADRARARIIAYTDQQLRSLRQDLTGFIGGAKIAAYRHHFLVAHWILDQVTPPNVPVRPNAARMDAYRPAGSERRDIGIKEALYDEPTEGAQDLDPETGEQVPSHETRIDGWLKAWQAAALSGLVVSGAMGGDAEDAEARIETAKAGGNDLSALLSRLVSTEVQIAVADAEDDFGDDYGRLIEERRWTTMDDERVCPICAGEEGKTEAQARYHIPAHPRCRCWWSVTPREYASLAGDQKAPGVGRTSMAFRDPVTGEVRGAVVVEFDVWKQRLGE
jgi:hypothetical protein